MHVPVIIVILALIVLLIGNTGRILYQWGKAIFGNPILFGGLFTASTAAILVPFVLSRIPDCTISRGWIQFGHYGLGVLLYTVLFVNLTAMVLFLGRLVAGRPKTGNLAVLIVCMALIAGLSGYGMLHAGNIRTVRYSITLDRQTEPVKIALISDLHMGFIIGEQHLQKVADSINQMEPDVVCIAGDLFDGDMTALSDPEAIQAVFHSIRAPIYACLGNHDAGDTYEQMLTFLSGASIRVLLDETVAEERLLLVGRRDSSPIGRHMGSRAQTVEIPAGNTLPVVVLDHQPGNIAEYSDDVDLILCGHTHRGQLFPGNLVTRLIYVVDYGYYRATETSPQVIVTSGVGTWGPVLRVGSDCEVVEITIN